MFKKTMLVLIVLALAAASAPLAVLCSGWLKFKRLESSIIDKLDSYYLDVTLPGREEYLLVQDEVFEVPYMASKLSVDAEPTRIFDRNGELIAEFQAAKGLYVRSSEGLPSFLKKAIVATEDSGFYEHQGVQWTAIARAAWRNILSPRSLQGGSTLTQQLAKMLFTTHERTLSRKTFELFCAKKIEEKFTKEQILLMYLNFVYLGHGCYGVECASRYYFGKPAGEMELGESAMIAGIIASPNNYSPFVKIHYSKARHRTVLHRMAQRGYLPDASIVRYSREFWNAMENRLEAPEASIRPMRINKAPYFTESIRRRLERHFPRERILRGGLKVHTTLDLVIQEAGRRALQEGLKEENREFSKKHPDAVASVEGALSAVDPRDGGVLAHVGGSGFTFSNQFDRASDGVRPIGSAIKPFVYASAFEGGTFVSTDTLIDARENYRQAGGKTWSPRNYTGKYLGEVTLETALRKSLNTVAVKLLDRIDIDDLISFLAKATGAARSRFERNLTLALGSSGLTPLELASAYAVFANGGHAVVPHAITRVEDREGRILMSWEPPEEKAPLLSTATCRTIRMILEGVFPKGGTAYAAARKTGFSLPAAGKTGTTNEYRDAWFAGFTPEISAAVRIGNDDMRISLGPGRSGGITAAPVWMRFIQEVYHNRPALSFPQAFDKTDANEVESRR